ncbi:redoxin domain-containing protein [Tamlana sp. s12]|uniref:TlpA disulfide reductase family protein n=1 Tax=Tamlana sp. s12 TaxID=1630406 RepID=UPI00083981B1|nr:TlpA disulfide reductase family protein [Tamlana sp. s12]QQY82121.1 redoxin domain-containing protein [Tamlana sp. s12]
MKNMYKMVFIMAVSALILGCKTKEEHNIKAEPANTFTLKADLKGLNAKYLIYTEKDDSFANGYRRDTLWVDQGKFTFTDSITDYKMYYITIPEANRSYMAKAGGKEFKVSVKAFLSRMWFIGYPGAEITYKGKVDEFMVDAYPSDADGINNDLAKIHKQIFPLVNKVDSITVASATNDYTPEERKELNAYRSEIHKKTVEIKRSFVESHPKSIAASYVLKDSYYRHYFTGAESQELFENLDSTTLAGTPFYDEVKLRLDAESKATIGGLVPEFKTTNTLDGSKFDLAALKGNYVLLDYWGTWCGPCMAEIPKIKAYNDKYADKNFVVVGVNSGDTAQRWKKVIANNNYNWTHIQTTKDNNLLIPFNVQSFPTKIVIDPEGKMIYSSKNPEKKDMYKMLDSIFSKPNN